MKISKARSDYKRAWEMGLMTTTQQADLGQQALRAFERDLPRLWAERPGQWVAFRGDHQLGFAAQKHQTYQQCFERSLAREDFVVFCIEPFETETVFGVDAGD
jgi:hypothetical protein